MGEIKLESCPFCGGKAVFEPVESQAAELNVRFRFRVKCQECLVALPNIFYTELMFSPTPYGEIAAVHDERKKAAAAWNQRAYLVPEETGKETPVKEIKLKRKIVEDMVIHCANSEEVLQLLKYVDEHTEYDIDAIDEQIEQYRVTEGGDWYFEFLGDPADEDVYCYVRAHASENDFFYREEEEGKEPILEFADLVEPDFRI